jgi:integrase
MQKTVNIFLDSLKSVHTKETYQIHWDRYLKNKPTVSRKPSVIEDNVIAYLMQMKNDGLSYSYRNNAIAAIHHHYKMTERRLKLNWEYIASFLGEKTFDNDIRGYTREEIKKMLDIADVKYNAIILTLASSVMRREALAEIMKEDLEPIQLSDKQKIYKIKIYKKTPDEQSCYTTPEAATAIDLHIKVNRNNHKELFHFKSPKYLTSTLRQIQIRSGVGQKHDTDGEITGQSRNAIPAVHGLRKFGITQMAKSGIDEEKRKILSGHTIGVQKKYVELTDEDLLQQYLKAINNLTINEENRLKSKVEVLEEKNKEIDKLKQDMSEMKETFILEKRLQREPDNQEVRKRLDELYMKDVGYPYPL